MIIYLFLYNDSHNLFNYKSFTVLITNIVINIYMYYNKKKCVNCYYLINVLGFCKKCNI